MAHYCLLSLILCFHGALLVRAQSTDGDVRSAAKSFFEAYQREDLGAIVAMWHTKSPELASSRQELEEIFRKLEIIEIRSVDSQITVGDNKAVLRLVVDIRAIEKATGKPPIGPGRVSRVLHFAREGADWKVWQYVTPEQEFATSLIEARTDEERSGLLAERRELVTVELRKALTSLGSRAIYRAEYPLASTAHKLAQTISEELRDDSGVAHSFKGLGLVNYHQGNLSTAREYYDKSLAIFERLNDEPQTASVLTNIGILHHVRENYSEALNYYARSLKLAEKNNEKSEEGRLLNNIGNIHQMQNDYARALEYYERSLKLARELGDRLLIARALNNVGIIGFLQANLPRALECFEASLEIAEQLGARDIVMRTLTNIGEIHRRRGDFQQAAEFSQRSVKLAEGTGDKDLLMRTLNNAGVIVRTQGDFPQALDYYNRSLKLAEELGSKRQVSTAYNNIGSVYDTQGDYTRASEYFHKGLKVAEEGNDRALVAALLFNIGNLHNKQGNHDQALDFYQKSLEIAEAIANQHDIVLAMNNMSTVYAVQGRFKRALEYLEKSLEIATRLNDRESIVSILSHIGSVHKLEGNYRQALDYYQKSLKSGEELGKRESVADSLNDLAEVQTLQDNFVESLALSNRAAETARQIGAPEALWRARAAAGNAHKALGQPDQARSSLEEAISVIETLRARVAGGEQAQQQFFQNRIGPYDSMVDLLIEQKNLTEALRFAERAKGRVLLDVVQSGRVDITRAMTEQQQAQERGLKLQLASLNSQIQREMIAPTPDRERLADLNDRLNRARLEYEHFEVRLYAEHPGLKIKRGKIEPLDLQQTARLLPDSRAALLEFVVMDEKTYLFVLTKRPSSQGPPGRRIADGGLNLAVYKITVTRKDLAGLVEQFRRSLADLDFSFVSQARSLYDLLLKPARSDLRNKTTLVIVPDDALWELPFNVLQPAPKQYLIEGAAISLAPSLSVLLHMKQVEVDGDRNSPALVAFGNPKIGKPTAERVASVFRDEELGPLPEAERQVKMLGLLYGRTRSRIFLGADAREDRVKAEGSSGRILHLATHGRLSDKNPMYSHLVMAQPEGAAADDGLLEAWEIMRLDLKADLVVFSACETGRGRIGRGEGVIGLAWASFVAGAPTTVVSAWKVDDRSTADLMLEFHRNLRLRKGKAAALRLASLKLLRTKDYKHPFYWAAFLVVGDGR